MIPRPSCHPDPVQSALLRACLLEDGAAAAALAEWYGAVDFDAMDAGSVRLLPLLAARIDALDVHNVHAGRCRGVQRQTWAKNQLLLRQLRSAIAVLAEADIRVMALKGTVLASSVYASASLRPMSDADLLVERSAVARAADVLAAAGWVPQSRVPRSDADYAVAHAVALNRGTEAAASEVDLHWRLFAWSNSREGEAALWANAVPLPQVHPALLAPGPADMLMHVCAHGAQWNGLPTLRWVADAAMLLNRGGLDWEHFEAQCRRFGVTGQTAATLDYLVDTLGLPVPAGLCARLRAASHAPIEKLIFEFEQLPFERRSFLPRVRLHLHRARSLMGAGPLALLRYAQRMRAGRSKRATLTWVLRRLLHRTG